MLPEGYSWCPNCWRVYKNAIGCAGCGEGQPAGVAPSGPSALSDEEFGRAWAGQQGYAPKSPGSMPTWAWWWPATGDGRIPLCVWNALPSEGRSVRHYATEAAAYAALGKAVRSIHAAVPPLASA